MFEGRGVDGPISVGIERKTLGDLTQSLQSGRLQGMETASGAGQLVRLHQSYDYVWLLIEGLWVSDEAGRVCQRRKRGGVRPVPGGFTEDSLAKRLLSLEIKGRLRMHQTSGLKQSAAWIASLYRWWTDKAWDEHRTLEVTHRHVGLRPISRFREIVMTLPGAGLAVSKAVETHYRGNLSALLQTSAATLAEVQITDVREGTKRLGRSKAQAIVEALRSLRGE